VSCTRVVGHQSELGSWSRASRMPDPRLRPLVAREYIGFRQEAVGFTRWLEPPRPVVSLLVTLEGPLRTDGRSLPGAWLGGLGGACAKPRTGTPALTSLSASCWAATRWGRGPTRSLWRHGRAYARRLEEFASARSPPSWALAGAT